MPNNDDLKVVPIGGKHRSFSSLAGEAMEDKRAVKGVIYWFEEDGTMHFGEFGMTRHDQGMVTMQVLADAHDFMRPHVSEIE